MYKRTGDLEILAALFERYMELVYGVCLKYLRNRENAQDAVMSIFEELVQKLKKHDIEHFRAWLYQVAKNYCLMQLRKDGNKKIKDINEEFMQLEKTGHPEDILLHEESLNQMGKCMELLPSEQKKAVELFYLEGKSYKEIAVLTGSDWNKVRSFIQNGRRNLKICMEQQVKSEI